MNTRILMASLIFASCAISQYEIMDNRQNNLTDTWCNQGDCIEFTDTDVIFSSDGDISTDTYTIRDNRTIESDIFGTWKEIKYNIIGDTLSISIFDGYRTTKEQYYRSR